MSKTLVERVIRWLKASARSIDDIIAIAHAMWDYGIGPDSKGLRVAEIEEALDLDLDYDPKTSVGHLEDLELVDAHFESHNEWHPVAQWMGDDGEMLFGDELDAAIREAIDALIDQMSDVSETGDTPAVADGGGATVRTVVADEFDYAPEDIDDYLLEHNEDAETLNSAVEAIEEAEGVSTNEDYGVVDFIPRAYYYRLTKRAVNLYER